MGKAKSKYEPEKTQLITQICSILARANACAHQHHRCPIRSPFIDWYLVLGIAENAGTEAIRKQYHKLALQLHPDKNKHPKAESAFKLVSEAYFCLSDNARKVAFDSKRKNSLCIECSYPPSRRNVEVEGISYPGRRKFNGIIQRMKNLRTRLEEEATIIDKCLKANAASKGEFPVFGAKTELPIFNPSDYQFQGYPHQRASNYTKPESFRFFMTRNRCIHTAVKSESPIFQCRSEREACKSRYTCIRSK
ncbi:Chaperone DnaJ-domain superfamily protein [Forsythia ovata]|uniref:Chaperone DnaJ-domain superfamily protein n=2 Tax=Forsythia ovata TaxID=205694 RepID=A0ABD1PJV6_9LAMI